MSIYKYCAINALASKNIDLAAYYVSDSEDHYNYLKTLTLKQLVRIVKRIK